MLAAEVLARFVGDSSSLVRAATTSAASIGMLDRQAATTSRGVASSMTGMGRSVEKVGMGFKSALGMVVKFGAAIGVMSMIGGAIAGVKEAFIDYNSLLEQTTIGFTTMLGSAEAATNMLDRLQDFGARTPFEFKGLITASQQLLAFGFEADQLIPLLGAVGDATAAMGGSMEDMGARVIRAMGQMQAKGKVSGEEMRQFAEAGIPAWQYLAEAIGVDIPTAMEKVRKEGLPAAIAVDAIIKGMASDFGGMMEAQSKTLTGAWSNVLDYTQRAVADATRPIYERFKTLVLSISDFFQSPQAEQMGKNFSQTISSGFEVAETLIIPIVQSIGRLIGEVIPMTIKLVQSMKPVWLAAGAAIVVAVTAVTKFLDVISATAGFIRENEWAMKALTVVVTALVAAFVAGKVIAFFNALKAGAATAMLAAQNMTRAKVAFSEYSATVAGGARGFAQFDKGSMNVIAKTNAMRGTMLGAKASFKGMGSALLGAVGGPAGLAVTGAIIGIGYAMQKAAADAQEAAQRTAEYRDRLVELNNEGANVKNWMEGISTEGGKVNRTIAEQMLKNEDLANVMRELDINVLDYTKHVTDGAQVMEAWDNVTDSTRINTEKFAKAILSGNTELKGFGAQGEVIKGKIQAAGLSMEQFAKSDYSRSIAEMALETGATSEQIGILVENLDEEADAFQKAYPAAQQLSEAEKQLAEDAERADKASAALGESVGSLAGSFEEGSRMAGEAGKAVAEAIDEMTGTLADMANPFEEWSEEGMVSLDKFQQNLKERLEYIGGFTDNLNKALAKGLDPGVFEYFVQQGPEQVGRVVKDLATKTPQEVASFNAQMREYLTLDGVAEQLVTKTDLINGILRDGFSTVQLKEQFGEGITDMIDTLPANVQAALDKNDIQIAGKFENSLRKALQSAQTYAENNDLELGIELGYAERQELTNTFGDFINSMPNREIIVGADPADALATITDFLVEVGKTPANVPIDGLDEPARAKAEAFIDFVEAQFPQIDFDADPEHAESVLAEFLALVYGSEESATINANKKPALQRLREAKEAILSTEENVTINGDNSAARRRIRETKDAIDSTSGTMSIYSNTTAVFEGVNSAIAAIQRMRATLFVTAQIRNPGQLSGGPQLADGGIVNFARGGLAVDMTKGQESHIAQIAPPGAWRVWAEPETGGEAYIPLAGAKRSRSINILAEVADRFGYVLMKQMEHGAILADSPHPNNLTDVGGGSGSIVFSPQVKVDVRANGVGDASKIGKVVEAAVKAQLDEFEKDFKRTLVKGKRV